MLRRCFVQGSSGHVCQDHSLGERLQAGHSDGFFWPKSSWNWWNGWRCGCFFWQKPCLFGSCFVNGGMQKTAPKKIWKKCYPSARLPFFGGLDQHGSTWPFQGGIRALSGYWWRIPTWPLRMQKMVSWCRTGCEKMQRLWKVESSPLFQHFRWWTVTSTWDFPSWNQFALENWWLEDKPFLFGPIFRGELLTFRECAWLVWQIDRQKQPKASLYSQVGELPFFQKHPGGWNISPFLFSPRFR